MYSLTGAAGSATIVAENAGWGRGPDELGGIGSGTVVGEGLDGEGNGYEYGWEGGSGSAGVWDGGGGGEVGVVLYQFVSLGFWESGRGGVGPGSGGEVRWRGLGLRIGDWDLKAIVMSSKKVDSNKIVVQ